jgi:hypothetical protein
MALRHIGLESIGNGVIGLNVHAYTPGSLLHEPRADLPHQHRPDAAALTLTADIDPLPCSGRTALLTRASKGRSPEIGLLRASSRMRQESKWCVPG